MISIKDLKVKLKSDDKQILNGLNLEIESGSVHAIMGPNGAGKSSLAKVLMGHYNFLVESGSIIFNDQEIKDLSVDERAKLGMFLSMQEPTSIHGVKISEFLKTAKEEQSGTHINYLEFINKTNNAMEELSIPKNMIHRGINEGFSGGEKKKFEVLALKVLEPKFIILDEIDSGLDVDSLNIVCKNICDYKNDHPEVSILIITHYPRILNLIKPDYVHILKNGKITKTGDINLAYETDEVGYHE